MEQYYGDKKIMGVTQLEQLTPTGNEMVKIIFEDGSEVITTKLRLDTLGTDEISDPTTMQNTIKAKVASMLFATLHEYGIMWGEINGIMDATVLLADAGFKKANDIQWGTEQDLISLNQINSVLAKDYAAKNNNGASSIGSGAN